ncbi:hypothetical protein S7711_04016 [Stachybotrys chartarum IBT 7711]|uniref:FAD-binding FR-type domain-containing protein n=1 Tax=Stachybotrys chartarum (strain CBS 109288 / IBT 7711) TaxID=1280523 RepID=A0A084AXH1_STACB|nr:hypothetical protein S7711_04016 [Stachybotrys chartarum IBT 7711]
MSSNAGHGSTSPPVAGNSTSAGGHGSHMSPERLAMFARRTSMNYESMTAFALAMAALALVFITFHVVRHATHRLGMKGPSFFVGPSRVIRRTFTRKIPVLPSAGHAALVFFYVAINTVITFTNMDNNNMAMNPNMASRSAWMAMGNLTILVLLGLKNTPLSLFTSWSYERLNILHQVAGYTTIAFIIIHASCYSSYFVGDGRPERLLYTDEIYGMVAACSFLVLGFAGAVIRRWWYELFYYLHVGFWMIAIVMTGLHQPELNRPVIVITMVAGSMWALDRLLRASRLVFYSVNNTATLTALPNGGTRVQLAKAPFGAEAGKHCFLWIPALRTFESHPFTIASMNPLEFVVASHDGFTRDLHRHAVEHPGALLKASVEGSYGAFPDASAYDKVVLVSGGSGASFTFGVALSLIKRLANNTGPQIEFIWVVKQRSYLHWFSTHLSTLQRNARVSLKIFVTRGAAPDVTISSKGGMTVHCESVDATPVSEDKETVVMVQSPVSTTVSVDLEKSLASDSEEISPIEAPTPESDIHKHIPVTCMRPDVEAVLRDAINSTAAGKSVLVMGCGPEGLMTQVRDTTARSIRADGPVVELHCERFGW